MVLPFVLGWVGVIFLFAFFLAVLPDRQDGINVWPRKGDDNSETFSTLRTERFELPTF